MADISYPAQKVHLHDTFGRHFGKFHWSQAYIYPTCRQPVCLLDSSAAVRKNIESNEGCRDPRQPFDMTPIQQAYTSPLNPIEPAPPAPMQYGRGYYMWTRGGLKGVDFGGSEVRTTGY